MAGEVPVNFEEPRKVQYPTLVTVTNIAGQCASIFRQPWHPKRIASIQLRFMVFESRTIKRLSPGGSFQLQTKLSAPPYAVKDNDEFHKSRYYP